MCKEYMMTVETVLSLSHTEKLRIRKAGKQMNVS